MGYKKISDFRSDTVTRPTPEMYKAINSASLGDDGYRDDPTVIELEELSAVLLGKEAAMLCTSGTMANQIAVRTFCEPGQEVIVEEKSHILNYESGGLAHALVQTRPILGDKGIIQPKQLLNAFRIGNNHMPSTGLLCLENTHNDAGGVVVPQENIISLSNIVHEVGVPVHLDGARIFNAHIANGLSVKEIAACVDSVMFCLSKGLSCPIGSVLCGSFDFIEKARKIRQYMGGGMRQAGIVAACGIVALNNNIDRLAEDHKRARELSKGLSEINGVEIINKVETNMVYFRIVDNDKLKVLNLVREAANKDVLFVGIKEEKFRMVCHKDIDDTDVFKALEVINEIIRNS